MTTVTPVSVGVLVTTLALCLCCDGAISLFPKSSSASHAFVEEDVNRTPNPPLATNPDPAGEHLALAAPDTASGLTRMTAAWHTSTATQDARVQWWNTAAGIASATSVNGTSDSYLVSPNQTAFVYRAVMGPLAPGTYSYHVLHNDGTVVGTTYSFQVDDVAKSSSKSIIFFGDSGNSPTWSEGTVPSVASEVASGGVSAVIHTGDMAYYAEDDNGVRGGIHEEQLANATAHAVPLMTVPGNADVFCYRPEGIPAWASCTQDYQRRYIMPGWNRTHSLWSSFSIGLVHVILLNSEAKLWCGATQNQTQQREFMEADLSSVNRTNTPWVVAVVHRPLYTSCLNGGEQQAMRDGFGDLFIEYGVDLVLHGHVHSYERTWPVSGDYNSTSNASALPQDPKTYRDPKAPVYVVAGTAGNGESIDDCSTKAHEFNWTFSVVRSNDIGYGRLRAYNPYQLQVEFYSVTKKRVIDEFTIERTAQSKLRQQEVQLEHFAAKGCRTDADCPYAGSWRCCGSSLRAENCPAPPDLNYGLNCTLPGTIGQTVCVCQAPSACTTAVYPAPIPGSLQVLLIGDSISGGISGPAATLGRNHGLQIVHIHVNGANVWWGSHCVRQWLGANTSRWDIITYNFGLHDLALDNERLEPNTTYAKYLKNITDQLKGSAPRAKLAWVTTTPVPLGIDGFCNQSTGRGGCPPRRNSDVPIYNSVAAAVVGQSGGISTIDFYGHVIGKCGAIYHTCPEGCTETYVNKTWMGNCYQIPQNVHYESAAWKDLASFYVNSVINLA